MSASACTLSLALHLIAAPPTGTHYPSLLPFACAKHSVSPSLQLRRHSVARPHFKCIQSITFTFTTTHGLGLQEPLEERNREAPPLYCFALWHLLNTYIMLQTNMLSKATRKTLPTPAKRCLQVLMNVVPQITLLLLLFAIILAELWPMSSSCFVFTATLSFTKLWAAILASSTPMLQSCWACSTC